jgi:hippurate hydrolase
MRWLPGDTIFMNIQSFNLIFRGPQQKIIELLNEFGVDSIKTKIGKSGIVAEIYGQKRESGRAIGFRADMDALPVSEMNNFSYKSKIENKMHACGHDGHTTIF